MKKKKTNYIGKPEKKMIARIIARVFFLQNSGYEKQKQNER